MVHAYLGEKDEFMKFFRKTSCSNSTRKYQPKDAESFRFDISSKLILLSI